MGSDMLEEGRLVVDPKFFFFLFAFFVVLKVQYETK